MGRTTHAAWWLSLVFPAGANEIAAPRTVRCALRRASGSSSRRSRAVRLSSAAVSTVAPHSEADPAFALPPWRDFVRHALPTVVEGTLIPVAVFWLAIRMLGPWTALGVGLAWVYLAIARRVVMHQRVPGVLVIAAVTATCRTLLAVSTHSLALYFLQPSLGTAMMAIAFFVSVVAGRPLAARLAHDFCPLPDGWVDKTWVRAFFLRISLLWAVVLLLNAALTIWLVLSQSVQVIAVARPLGAGVLTVTAIAASAWHFQRSLRRHEPLMPRWSLLRRAAA